MKERPIIFKAQQVRTILAGYKTQDRLVVNLRNGQYMPPSYGKDPNGWRQMLRLCPYGQPGDRLWVRETFSGPHIMEKSEDFPAMPPSQWPEEASIWYWADGEPTHGDWTRPRPSIHMPRWASRITLEITGVRVERLHDISESDADAEGCERLDDDRDERDRKLCWTCGGTRMHSALGSNGGVIYDVDCLECDTYVKRYRKLWESIKGNGSWDANPWVWVLDFKRV